MGGFGMDDELKSALDIAREKVDKIGEATPEERLKWKYIPEGERLATKYLKQDINLLEELSKYDKDTVKYVKQGASSTLVRNLSLPKTDPAKKINKRIMDGVRLVKNNKVEMENVYTKIRYLFNHYVTQGEQQRKQAYQQLKAEMGAKFQQALQQQAGLTVGMKVDVERQPQFQEEWYKLQHQLDNQYLRHLDEHKQELVAIE